MSVVPLIVMDDFDRFPVSQFVPFTPCLFCMSPVFCFRLPVAGEPDGVPGDDAGDACATGALAPPVFP